MEISDQNNILLSLLTQVTKSAHGCQHLPVAEPGVLAVVMVIFLDVNINCCSPSWFLFYMLPVSLLQPSAAVRGYHSSKTSSISSSWASGVSGGQESWSSHFTHASLQQYIPYHQQHRHHHPPSTQTSYSFCTDHTAVSNAFSPFAGGIHQCFSGLSLFSSFW